MTALASLPGTRPLAALATTRVRKPLFIELPADAGATRGGAWVSKFHQSLYGTRDAAAIWADCLRRVLVDLGFVGMELSPGVYAHRGRGLELAVHVDDCLATTRNA